SYLCVGIFSARPSADLLAEVRRLGPDLVAEGPMDRVVMALEQELAGPLVTAPPRLEQLRVVAHHGRIVPSDRRPHRSELKKSAGCSRPPGRRPKTPAPAGGRAARRARSPARWPAARARPAGC